jgi:hypothetical protein
MPPQCLDVLDVGHHVEERHVLHPAGAAAIAHVVENDGALGPRQLAHLRHVEPVGDQHELRTGAVFLIIDRDPWCRLDDAGLGRLGGERGSGEEGESSEEGEGTGGHGRLLPVGGESGHATRRGRPSSLRKTASSSLFVRAS